MNLKEIVKKSQSRNRNTRELYTKKLFEYYREYFFKLFAIYSPYTNEADTVDFISGLGTELLGVLEKKISNFNLKNSYENDELEHHLWIYLGTIADALLDRFLLQLSLTGKTGELKETAGRMLREKYRTKVQDIFSGSLSKTETRTTAKLSGFELEEFLEQECRRLTDLFFNSRFPKIVSSFKNHPRAIFRNYVESAVKNYFIDYMRAQSAKKSRRLVLYRGDLPEELFEYLKNLKGCGTLFYYKKKYDCLTIRETGKALSVIKELNLPEKAFEDIRYIFKKSHERAEYQRVIDNITAYITANCSSPGCGDRLRPKDIKVLLYISDYVMQEFLKQTRKDIAKAKGRLKKCVVCLDIEEADF